MNNTINGRTPEEIKRGQSFSEYLDEALSKVNFAQLEDEGREQKKRTPEEIKKGLECCSVHGKCDKCPYDGMPCNDLELERDALAYIRRLEHERDAAVERCVNADDVSAGYYQEIQQLESAQPKWISVEDEQKPKHGKEYLCVCSLPDDPKHEWDWIMVLRWYAYGTNGYVDRPHFTDEGLNGMIVTHWMELPKRPKEEE